MKNIHNTHDVPTMYLDAFNGYFHSVFAKGDGAALNGNTNLSSLTILIGDIDITEEEVNETLASLDATKSTGPDGIGPRILYAML